MRYVNFVFIWVPSVRIVGLVSLTCFRRDGLCEFEERLMGRPASNGLWWIVVKEVSAPPARNPSITDALMRQGPARGFFPTDRHLTNVRTHHPWTPATKVGATARDTRRGPSKLTAHSAHRGCHGRPLGISPPGASATCPTDSMPKTRGKRTEDECPWRVKSSERLIPKALTRMRIHTGSGSVLPPCTVGDVTAVPKVGGLHHYYTRLAA